MKLAWRPFVKCQVRDSAWTRRLFSFTYFFRSFCFSHGKLITGTERVVNVYIRVYFRCALIGRFLTARSEGRHSKFKAMRAMRAGFHSTPSPSHSESLLIQPPVPVTWRACLQANFSLKKKKKKKKTVPF